MSASTGASEVLSQNTGLLVLQLEAEQCGAAKGRHVQLYLKVFSDVLQKPSERLRKYVAGRRYRLALTSDAWSSLKSLLRIAHKRDSALLRSALDSSCCFWCSVQVTIWTEGVAA